MDRQKASYRQGLYASYIVHFIILINYLYYQRLFLVTILSHSWFSWQLLSYRSRVNRALTTEVRESLFACSFHSLRNHLTGSYHPGLGTFNLRITIEIRISFPRDGFWPWVSSSRASRTWVRRPITGETHDSLCLWWAGGVCPKERILYSEVVSHLYHLSYFLFIFWE